MSIDYENLVKNLNIQESHISSIIIVESEKEIVYSSENWNFGEELAAITSTWETLEIKPIIILGKRFSTVQVTPERLIATSLSNKGHFVAAKDDERKIITICDPAGDLTSIFTILTETLRTVSTKEPYMDKDAILGKPMEHKIDNEYTPPESRILTEEEKIELKAKIDIAAEWIIESKKLVFFTGAGLSTESGIPDFRGLDGLWTRKDKGLRPLRPRSAAKIKPNSGHFAIVELLKLGRVDYVITQNADGLHSESGIPLEKLSELHGNKYYMVCLECNRKMTFKETNWDQSVWGPAFKQIPFKKSQPTCPYCQGRIVSSVISFGQKLPYDVLYESMIRSENSDLYFVVGSSCVVTPAANLIQLAKNNGAKLIILNLGETPYDKAADIRFFNKIGDILPPIVEKIKENLY